MILKYSVGSDISAEHFHACLSTISTMQVVKVKASKKFPNTPRGFNLFLTWCKKHHKLSDVPMHFCMEATGVYHENLAHFLHNKKQRVAIVLANLSNKYLESLGTKTKNDPIDAQGLARMGAERNLKAWNPPVKFYAELRAMTRHQQGLKEQKTMITNKIHALEFAAMSSKIVLRQLKKSILQIQKQIKEIEESISLHLDSNKEVRRKVDQVCLIKGVGEITISVIIAETYGFELFKNAKQLISYAGYDVVQNQSGNRNGKTRISKKGNSRIRRILHLPSFTAVKYQQGNFSLLHERLLSQHGIKMKAYVAVQKKILTTIYALWKKDEAFDPNYYKNIQEKEQKPSYSVKKSSPDIIRTTRGKHPVKNHCMSPIL